MTESQRWILGGGLVCGCLGVAGLGGFFVLALGFSELGTTDTAVYPNITAQQQQTVARLTHLSFPPSATFRYYHLEGFQDYHLVAIVRFPRQDLSAFLGSEPLKNAKFSTTERSVTWVEAGFDPTTVAVFRSTTVEIPPNDWLQVLIDEGDPASVTVYMEFTDP